MNCSLSRDVYQYNMYTKRGSGKLPIKWLAIESLTHQVGFDNKHLFSETYKLMNNHLYFSGVHESIGCVELWDTVVRDPDTGK